MTIDRILRLQSSVERSAMAVAPTRSGKTPTPHRFLLEMTDIMLRQEYWIAILEERLKSQDEEVTS